MVHVSGWFKGRRGFTMIELGVSVTVIAALVVTLLPALSDARNASIRAACLDNHRVIGVAYQQYIADYNTLPGQNPGCYGTGATIYPVGTSPTGPFWGTTVNIWSDVAIENDPGYDGATYTNTSLQGGFKTVPVGHGTLATYLSSDGTFAHANGKVYYCPGTLASFNAQGGYTTEGVDVQNPSWYPFYWKTPSNQQTVDFVNAYGGYYTGWAAFGAPSSYLAWYNDGKPTGHTPDNMDNVCLSTYAWRGGEWTLNKNLPLTDNAGWANNWTYNQLQSPTSPNVQNRITMTCFWWNGYYSFNQPTSSPGGNHPENIPHAGRYVNNLWTDGHAASYKLPPNQPVAVWTWYAFDWSPNQATFNPTDLQLIGGFYEQMPFWWGLADQQAP